jgi:opacity protein-like surface antigen
LNAGAYFVDMGNSFMNYDPGVAVGAALGYRIADRFRVEGEFKYLSNDANYTSNFTWWETGTPSVKYNATQQQFVFLLNGYYDFKNQTPFTPFIMAGVGGSHWLIEENYFGHAYEYENNIDFTYQLGAGLNYKYTDRLSFDVKYNYLSDDKTEFGLGAHQVMAGIRLGF